MNEEINEMSINGIEYVRKDSVSKEDIKGDIKIVVLQRGWIFVGRFEKGSPCKLHNAFCIRRWGTTQGLGELALNGPLSNTVLDRCNGIVGFDYLTVVLTLDCSEAKWKNSL